jgi:hypothetical protein
MAYYGVPSVAIDDSADTARPCFGAGNRLLAAFNVRYRDIRYAPVLTQIWLHHTCRALVVAHPRGWRPLYALNPMVGVVEGSRPGSLPGDVDRLGVTVVAILVTTFTSAQPSGRLPTWSDERRHRSARVEQA